MTLQHLNVKLFLAEGQPLDLEPFIAVFNDWIQAQAFGELLIDVADYRHVADGPGLVLIGHTANYSLDQLDGRPGLLYNRKAAVDSPLQARLAQAVGAALLACQKLEREQGLRFNTQVLQLTVNERLAAPNTDATLSALEPELRAFLATLYTGAPYTLVRTRLDPRERFTVEAQTSAEFGLDALLGHLAGEAVHG